MDVLENVVIRSPQAFNDHELFRFILDVFGTRRQDPHLTVAAEQFSKTLQRLMAIHGRTPMIFLYRHAALRDEWKRLWSLLEPDLESIEYNGTDTLADYVFLVVLRSSSLEMLRRPSSSSISVQSGHVSATDEFGVYGEEDASISSGEASPVINMVGSDTEIGLVVRQTNRNRETVVDSRIPPALIKKYQRQGAYMVGTGRTKLASRKWKYDHDRRKLVQFLLDGLSAEKSEGNKRKIVPSPNLMEIIRLIDECAVQYGSTVRPTPPEIIKSALEQDQTLRDRIHALLDDAFDGLTRTDCELFLRFVLDVMERSIWKMVRDKGGFNGRNKNSASFRINVQFNNANNLL